MGNLQLSPGSLFANRFEIDRAAGSGGMGTVYRAKDRYSGDVVALKLLHAGKERTDEAERFAREAQLLSELRHPGIVAYVAHGKTPDGQRFLAMEWLDGQDLSERLARGPLPVRDCLRLLEQVADALSVAHQRGIIHRDLKPSNLFLSGGDIARVKILDFGIARRIATSQAMTKTGMVVGTPEYMAPEQARGTRDLTPATDLFSIGCVLYECLTGQPPFIADHVAAVLVRILFEEPIPVEQRRPGVPASLSALLGRLLKKDPAKRVANATALRTELLSLGEMPEPALAVTAVSSRPQTESFADQEQNLFSIVLAAPSEEEIGLGATQPASDVPLGTANRQALLQALAGLGSSPDFLANGTLVVTVPPLDSAQDQAILAARAALLIKERWPDAVVSMATGRGAIRERTAVGEVVELAARSLKSGSHPSLGKPRTGVLIDALSAKLLEGRFAQTPQPSGAILLHEERDMDASRPLLGKPTPCVGREAELANLEAQLTVCIEESEARAVLITAQPGAGKSRLRHEFLRQVEKRSELVTVLLGRGDMMSAGAPYRILRSAIHKLCGISGSEPLDIQRERLQARVAQHLPALDSERVVLFVGELCNVPFPEVGKPMLQAARQEPKLMRDCLRRALLDFFAAECATTPVLLLLDDLQWADELTVSVLDEALREQTGAPFFVLSFARPELHEIFPKLWQGHKIQELQLKGLSKKACERLIKQALGRDIEPAALAHIVEQSAGNALFLEELIRSVAAGEQAEYPQTVLAMLQARIGRLDTGARRLVRAAAVFGQTFWRGGIAAILGLAGSASDLETWLAALTDAELIQPQPSSRLANEKEYRFRHALVRDACYQLLSAGDLATGHRLAGEFLEASGESDPGIIAEHYGRSGDKTRAASFYLRAAEDSLMRGSLVGALHQVERGLLCNPPSGLLASLHSTESCLAYWLDQLDLADRASRAALTQLRPGCLGWCRAMSPAIYGAANQGNLARGFELVSLLLRTEPDEDARAVYIETLGSVHAYIVVAAPAAIARAVLDRIAASVATAETDNLTVRRHLCSALASMAILREPRPWTATTEYRRAMKLHDQAGDSRLSHHLSIVGIEWGWLELGDVEGVRQRLAAVAKTMAQSEDRIVVGQWRYLLARALCMSPKDADWNEAQTLLSPLLTQEGGMILFPFFAQDLMARLSLLRGQMQEAEAHGRLAMQFLSIGPAWGAHNVPVYIEALLGLGQASEAAKVAEQSLGVLAAMGGLGMAEVGIRFAAGEALHAAGQSDRANRELRETLRQIQLRADDITDPFWKNSYLTRNPYCVRAQQLAKEWGLDVIVK